MDRPLLTIRLWVCPYPVRTIAQAQRWWILTLIGSFHPRFGDFRCVFQTLGRKNSRLKERLRSRLFAIYSYDN